MKESEIAKTKTFTLLPTILVMAAAAVTAVAAASTIILFYQGTYNHFVAYPLGNDTRDYTFGTISSIQNDKNAWIVAGHWKTNLLDNLSSNKSMEGANVTRFVANGKTFDVQIEMVGLDGTAEHTHTITNFVLANASQPDNMTEVINSTTTASMMGGLVTDIPTTIKVMGDKVVSIQLDPSKIDEHYGNTPIYGIVMDDHKFKPSSPPKIGLMKMGNNG
jgi:hypothetical protein